MNGSPEAASKSMKHSKRQTTNVTGLTSIAAHLLEGSVWHENFLNRIVIFELNWFEAVFIDLNH